MFSSAPAAANASETIGITSVPRSPSPRTSDPTACFSAPVSSTTVKAPPTRKTKKMTEAASIMPCGTARSAAKGPTGCGSTWWKDPATTTRFPVSGSSRRSY